MGVPILAVLLVLAGLVVTKVVTGSGSPKSGTAATVAAGDVIAQVTSVPTSTLDAVGAGTVKTLPKAIAGSAPLEDGKPRFLYVGAEYCPYCATERWAVVVALSRFGTFTNLGQTASSPSDVYPSTATLTFHGATYTSCYLSFTGKETQSNQVVNGTYAVLDTLSDTDNALVSKYDSAKSIPFIYIGGKYIISGASYDPSVLAGKTHAEVAAALSDSTAAIAKGVDGTANIITAAICATTANQPAAVCASPAVNTAIAALNNGG